MARFSPKYGDQILIQNRTVTKDIMKEVLGNVCHVYHAAVLDVYQQTSCNLQHKGTSVQKPGFLRSPPHPKMRKKKCAETSLFTSTRNNTVFTFWQTVNPFFAAISVTDTMCPLGSKKIITLTLVKSP